MQYAETFSMFFVWNYQTASNFSHYEKPIYKVQNM